MGLLRFLDKLVEVAAVLAFAASSLFICINVINRYTVLGGMRTIAKNNEWFVPIYQFCRDILGSISVMADEVPGYLLVWIAFLGAYLVLRREGHISFDMLQEAMPEGGRRIIAALNLAMISGFLVLLLYQSVRMIRVSGATEIETAEIAQGWFMTILPLSAVLFLIAIVPRAYALLKRD